MPAARRGFRSFGSTGTEALAAAAPLRARARHAANNNAWIANGVAAIVAEAVGAGIKANSAHPNQNRRAALDTLFEDFAAGGDAEGRTDLNGLLAQMVRATVVDGEAFALIEPEGLRLIPAEMVDESLTRETRDGGYIVAGVEHDQRGRRVAYHIQPARPTEVFTTAAEPIRVPADEVLHLFRPLGPGQVRGVSWLAPVLLTINELDQLQDAMLVGQKISAMHAGFIVDQNNLGGGDTGFPEESDGGDVSLEPGTIRRLGAGEDIKFSQPDQASEGVPFAKLTLRQISAGLGLPTHLLDGDLSDATYSSLRAGLLPFRQKIEQFQKHNLIPQVLTPVWRLAMTRAFLGGAIDDLQPSLRVGWLPPRPMQVDPLKDTQALKEQIAAGLTSRRKAAASLGWNLTELDKEIAADRDRAEALNLNFGEATNGT